MRLMIRARRREIRGPRRKLLAAPRASGSLLLDLRPALLDVPPAILRFRRSLLGVAWSQTKCRATNLKFPRRGESREAGDGAGADESAPRPLRRRVRARARASSRRTFPASQNKRRVPCARAAAPARFRSVPRQRISACGDSPSLKTNLTRLPVVPSAKKYRGVSCPSEFTATRSFPSLILRRDT